MRLFSRQRLVRVFLDRHVPHASGRELGRGLVAQGTVRAFGIVLLLPQRAQRPGLGLALELLAVQELVAELAVERLRVAILPGARRRHVQRPGAGPLQPIPHRLRRELRAVVAADPMRRAPATRRDLGQDDADLLGRHAPACLQRQAFTSVLINQTQPLQAPAVAGTIENEVTCPYVVFAARRPEVAGVRVLAVRAARPRRRTGPGQFQPRQAPDPPHRLLVDRPALPVQQRPDPPVAEPRVRAGQLLDPPGQGRPLVPHDRRVPETGAGQAQRPGHATLRYAELFTYVCDDRAASGGGHGFFFKASWSMR